MFEILQPLIEPIWRLLRGFNVFRYIASSEYRLLTHERWRHEKTILVVGNVIGGLLVLALSVGVAYLIVMASARG